MMKRHLWLLIFVLGILYAFQKAPVLTDQEKLIVTQIRGLRSVPDQDRGSVTTRLADSIRKLPPDANKVDIANALASLSTEGDFGHDTLQAVAKTLADALQEQPSAQNEPFEELAQLVRYEHVSVSLDRPELAAALEKLKNEDRDREQVNFTLTDLQGKNWTLKNLSGHVVVVNFWATWCPPCRKEMPDLDALYQHYRKQGLIVLSVSYEEADKVQSYLAQHPVSYPILLDPGRRVTNEFHVEGIPRTLVYDSKGVLAAQAIDMRTRAQFLDLLSKAGLKTDR